MNDQPVKIPSTNKKQKSKQPLVLVIILNWNKHQLIVECVRSILKNTDYKNFEVVIVDNGSTDGSVEALKKIKGITVISLKENYGFSKGMNTGACYALHNYSPDYLAFVNNDTLFIQKNWLATLISELENDPQAAIATPRFRGDDGTLVYAGASYGVRLSATVSHRIPVARPESKQYVTTNYAALVLVKTEAIQKIGLFDERFAPFWHEDHDFDKRLLKAGYKISYDPSVTLQHGCSKTLNTIEKKSGRQAMLHIERKNCIRFARKHFSFPLFLIVFFYKITQSLIDRKGIHNPIWAFKLLTQLDFKKEKVWISYTKAKSRIREIIKR